MSAEEQQRLRKARERLEKLAWVLDESIRIPGTNKRIGLDPIIGLLPGAGDAVGVVLSLWVVVEAGRLGAPAHMITRMLGNVFIEAVVGIIPIAGDLFDFIWKANSRNRDMLIDYIDHQLEPEKTPAYWVWVMIGLLVLLAVLLFYSPLASGPN